MAPTVRRAAPADAAAIAEIYNEALAERRSTFETEPRAGEDFADALGAMLVAENAGGRVAGWARSRPYSERACYAGIREASVYVAGAARGRGLGRRLLGALAAEIARGGGWKVVGLVFESNAAARALCRGAGCREVGLLRRHGRLDGQWRDVVLVELLVGEAG